MGELSGFISVVGICDEAVINVCKGDVVLFVAAEVCVIVEEVSLGGV